MSDYPLPQPLALTIIQQIAMHLLAASNGDISAARKAAAQTLAWYNPANVPELYLAAKIITFNLQAGEALASAADPTVPLNRQMRLRSAAISLDREARKADRALEKLREPQRTDAPKPAQPPAQRHTPQPQPKAAAPAAAPSARTDQAIAAAAKAHGIPWSEGMNQQSRDQALAAIQAKESQRFLAAVQAALATANPETASTKA